MSRAPYDLTLESEFIQDFGQLFKSLTKKGLSFDYILPAFKLAETNQVELRLVKSKGSVLDLVAFALIGVFLVLLQFACRMVGTSVKQKDN